MKAPDTKIGVTLYNLRDHCKNEADLASTLERVRGFGYQAVQISGIGDIKPERVKTLLDANGLYCCATHEKLDALKNDFERTVDKLKLWECDFSAIGSGGPDYFRPGGAADLAKELDEIGTKFAEHDIRFGFHNHHREFARFEGKIFIEELFEKSSAENVCFELDLHWVQRGGGNPVSWIRKCAGRAPVVHFKDYSIVGSDPIFCEVGEGNLEWASILDACRESGVRWYVFEQDQPVEERDIFGSIELTYKNLVKMGVS